MAAAIDPAGNVWSAGVSSNPATGRLDLALWKYGPNAALAGGFPVFWPDAFAGTQNISLGLGLGASGAVWVAASRIYPGNPAADLALLRYDSNGVLISSSLWHNAQGAAVRAADLSLDASGNPWVVGYSSNTPAVWRYDASGNLASGYPQTTATADFDGDFINLDRAGTPWVADGGAPAVFAGNVPVPARPVPVLLPWQGWPRSRARSRTPWALSRARP